MSAEQPRRNAMLALRAIPAALGAVMVLAALLGDRLTGGGGGIGRTQVLLLVVGLLLLLGGILAQRAVPLYKAVALMALNTVVLLVVLELGAAVLGTLLGEPETAGAGGMVQVDPDESVPMRGRLPYYASRDWGAQHWVEYASADKRTVFHPYVMWRTAPFASQTINVDSATGNRRTPGADCRPGSFKVFTFGGSGMWGVGSPDWGTIAAHLQTQLAGQMERPVCVVNYGERGFVVTQGAIQLMRQLQYGNVPDLALFYDSVNDVETAYVYGRAGLPMGMEGIASKLEGRDQPAPRWFESTSIYQLLSRFAPRQAASTAIQTAKLAADSARIDSVASSVVTLYLETYDMVDALARQHGFAYGFFWQPHIVIGAKRLTAEERAIAMLAGEQARRPFNERIFARIAAAARQRPHLHYLGGVFDREPSLVYVDSHHLTPEGNEIVARAMVGAMRPALRAAVK
ncbi:MAG: hypothetical protein ACREON_03825 [Gemmatimonadaceae bacterium]